MAQYIETYISGNSVFVGINSTETVLEKIDSEMESVKMMFGAWYWHNVYL